MTRASLPLLLLPILVAMSGCGRGELVPLAPGLGSDDGSADGASSTPDASKSDASTERDASVKPDGGIDPTDAGEPDAGDVTECMDGRDCFSQNNGPPMCGPDSEGRWRCERGACVAECVVSERCASDCDCPFDLACLGNVCQPAGRENLCCDNPRCPQGAQCVEPDGQGSFCDGPPESGVGAGCGSDVDCEQGMTCLRFSGQGTGYCSVTFCDAQSNQCPPGSQCYAFPEGFTACLAECAEGGGQSTCRPGQFCFGPVGEPGVCFPQR